RGSGIAILMVLGGVSCVVLGVLYSFKRQWRIAFSGHEAEFIRKGIAIGEVTVIEIEADEVIPAPSFDEDEDAALFRVGPEGYIFRGESEISRLQGWLDGRYPSRVTIGRLASGDTLQVTGGSASARVSAPLSEEACLRISKYIEDLVERHIEHPESRQE